MTELEKVKKGMECCTNDVHDPYTCRECPYLGHKPTRDGCIQPMLLDALSILREYEPVRHGMWIRAKWVEDEDWQEGGYWILRCSECVMPYHNPTPYCPHCGAKMLLELSKEENV